MKEVTDTVWRQAQENSKCKNVNYRRSVDTMIIVVVAVVIIVIVQYDYIPNWQGPVSEEERRNFWTQLMYVQLLKQCIRKENLGKFGEGIKFTVQVDPLSRPIQGNDCKYTTIVMLSTRNTNIYIYFTYYVSECSQHCILRSCMVYNSRH